MNNILDEADGTSAEESNKEKAESKEFYSGDQGANDEDDGEEDEEKAAIRDITAAEAQPPAEGETASDNTEKTAEDEKEEP